jgi:hypothetical protein
MNLQFGKDEQTRRMIWVSNYIMEREYGLPRYICEALNFMNKLIYEKKLGVRLAASTSNKYFENKFNVTIGIKILIHYHNARMSYVKNGLEAYAQWSRSRRGQGIPNRPTVSLCACGCGAKTEKGRKYINGHNNNHEISDSTSINKISTEKIYDSIGVQKLCACGCGEYVTKTKNKYINGHNARMTNKDVLVEKAKAMREAKKRKKSKS